MHKEYCAHNSGPLRQGNEVQETRLDPAVCSRCVSNGGALAPQPSDSNGLTHRWVYRTHTSPHARRRCVKKKHRDKRTWCRTRFDLVQGAFLGDATAIRGGHRPVYPTKTHFATLSPPRPNHRRPRLGPPCRGPLAGRAGRPPFRRPGQLHLGLERGLCRLRGRA